MSDMSLRIIISSQNNSGPGFGQVRSDVRGIDDQIAALGTRLNQFLAFKMAEVFTHWAAEVIKTADSYQTLAAKLDMSTSSHEEALSVQKALFDVAQRSRASFALTEDVYIKNADAIKRLGGSTEQAIQVTETLEKAIASTSQGMAQDQAVLLQWGQAIGSGVLAGDELKSIMENSLGVSRALAEGLGVPIGKLKLLGSEGKLTGVDLANAMLKVSGSVDATFSHIPMTVSQSMQLVENSWVKFIGETNQAYGATQVIAKGFEEASKHVPELVEGVLQLTVAYGVKLAAGYALATEAKINEVAATRVATEAAAHETVVNIELLRVQAQVMAMRVNAARVMAEEARVQLALAATLPPMIVSEQRMAAVEVEAAEAAALAGRQRQVAAQLRVAAAEQAVIATSSEAAAVAELAAATAELAIIEGEATASSTALAGAELRLTAAMDAANVARAQIIATSADAAAAQDVLAAATRNLALAEEQAALAALAHRDAMLVVPPPTIAAASAVGMLGKALNGLLIGWVVYEGLKAAYDYFESVRMWFIKFAEDLTVAKVELGHFLSGDFITDSGGLAKKLAAIHVGYGQIKQAATDAAMQQQEGIKRVNELLAAQEIKRKTVFKDQQEQLKDTTAQVDAQYSQQLATIKTSLEQRKVAIAGMGIFEIDKEQLVSAAIRAAKDADLAAVQRYGDARLRLVAGIYDTELAKVKAGTVEQKEVERKSIEERIAVYVAMEKDYRSIIDGLIAEDQRHTQAAAELLNQRKLFEEGTEDAIRALRRGSMTDERAAADMKKQLDEELAKERAALAAGDYQAAKRYGEEAAKMAQDLAGQSQAAYKAGVGYSSDADKFIKKFSEARQGIAAALAAEGNAHIEEQKRLADSISDTQGKLAEVQSKINALSSTLREKFLLKIDANTDAVDLAIERLSKTTESWHIIHVTEDRSQVGGGAAVVPEGHRFGGPIQAFAEGGFPRVSGQLPGYGGGDRVRALLEDGEFVLRKEAVKANGKKTIQAINDGQLQIAPIKLFNSGGAVDGEERGGNGGYSSAGSFDTGSPSDTVDALLAKLAALKKQQQADQAMEKALGVNFWPNWQAIAASDRIYDKAKQTIEANIQQAQAAEADKARAQVAANLQQKLDEQNAQYLHPSLAPMFALNQPKPLPALTANMPDIKQTALAASGSRSGGGGKTITLRFESPDGKQAVSGNFAESDAQKMMEILRMSGARTTGGMF
jgi:tape measure domain-containing protein